jgi:hypothetical protein
MSTRAKWLACLGALVGGALSASIPAFIDRSPHAGSGAAEYAWLEHVPLAHGPALPDPSTPIGSAPDGQKLLATRIGAADLCMRFGSSGRQCVSVVTDKHIQLVARRRGPEENVLWGLVADGVAAIHVRHSDGTVASSDASRGFGVLETRAKKVASISAFDERGRRVGSVSGDAFVPVSCVLTSCVTIDVS